eukprot:TRINITY_DN17566_c0_g1_i1.p1 TRINITY_DN17566_c0_g1~~TRINITY_DN17566_c0_g1_i1.p1  ORF type:complete len:789 (-),score=258.28 TRINITY_DN17566_c0_g1_i1:78-2237(-)
MALAGREDLPVRNYLFIKGFVVSYLKNASMPAGKIGLNVKHLRTMKLAKSKSDSVVCQPYCPTLKNIFAVNVQVEVDLVVKTEKNNSKAFEGPAISLQLQKAIDRMFVSVGQQVLCFVDRIPLQVEIKKITTVSAENLVTLTPGCETEESCGIITQSTVFQIRKSPNASIRVDTGEGTIDLKSSSVNAQELGIGGLDAEFNEIFRRAFVTRLFPPAFIEKLGIRHVKGILLYGPPGTGKTLMARQIGKMFNGREPKIVAGPEVLNKFVGQSEENIRNLFKDAEEDYKKNGDAAELHVIIFDEIDAVCRARGSRGDSTGVGDTVVNQLLAKIDGVEALNNILVIGMTNRLDLIDEALTRPGRLEVKMEIGLPNEDGRVQILRIHTNMMANNGYLGKDVDMMALAKLTKNFSGAELEGLVKSATSFALGEKLDPENVKKPKDPNHLAVTLRHFTAALSEVKPAFGMSADEFENCIPNGIIDFGVGFRNVMRMGQVFISQVQAKDTKTPIVSMLLHGSAGCGKTAIASKLGVSSGFAYVKMISAESLVGYGEAYKCTKIVKAFDDAYKSPLSVIVVDDIERLMEYVPVGPRFSNAVLQMLLVLVKKAPPKGRRLLVIGTTSNASVLKEMDFYDVWDTVLNIPPIRGEQELYTVLKELKVLSTEEELKKACEVFGPHGAITIKKLISRCETARRVSNRLEVLCSCLEDASSDGLHVGAGTTPK